jgi:hypothetical protein
MTTRVDSSTSADTTTSAGTATSADTTTTDDPTVDPDDTTDGNGCTPQDECISDEDCVPGQACIGCICFGDPSDCEGAPGVYGDCLAETDTACMGGASQLGCLIDDDVAPTVGVCFFACEVACDCPQAPEGFQAQVTCGEVTGAEQGECYIDCSGGQGCPGGMVCFANFLCAWESPDAPPQAS